MDFLRYAPWCVPVGLGHTLTPEKPYHIIKRLEKERFGWILCVPTQPTKWGRESDQAFKAKVVVYHGAFTTSVWTQHSNTRLPDV